MRPVALANASSHFALHASRHRPPRQRNSDQTAIGSLRLLSETLLLDGTRIALIALSYGSVGVSAGDRRHYPGKKPIWRGGLSSPRRLEQQQKRRPRHPLRPEGTNFRPTQNKDRHAYQASHDWHGMGSPLPLSTRTGRTPYTSPTRRFGIVAAAIEDLPPSEPL